MVKGRSGLRFLDKAGLGLGVPRQLRRQKLEGNRPLELRILGLIDDAHPPSPIFSEHSVVGNLFADHPHTSKCSHSCFTRSMSFLKRGSPRMLARKGSCY